MSADHVLKTIEMIQGEIGELDRQLTDRKRMVNELCRFAGRPALYADAALASAAGSSKTRPDEYYGKPLATVIRLVLEKRQAGNLGAATVNEIYDEMVAGGYHFQAKSEENAKRGLYTSLGKSTHTFHKLPNGTYGLKEWYPDAPRSKENGGSKAQEKPLHEELQEEAEVELDEEFEDIELAARSAK